MLNGTPLVALASQAGCRRRWRGCAPNMPPNAPAAISLFEGEPAIARINPSRLASSPQAAAEILDRHLTVEAEGYAIFVNHNPLILLDSKESATDAIALMLQQGMDDKNGIPTIQQRVTIDLMHLTKEKIGSIPIMTSRTSGGGTGAPPAQAILQREGRRQLLEHRQCARRHGVRPR